MVKLARTSEEVSRGLDGESWSVLFFRMGSLQQDAFHDQVHQCHPCHSTGTWGVRNALGKLEYFEDLKFWFSYCLGKVWEVYFLSFFYLLWWQNKCILESFSELMLRGFFMTSTMTRDKAKGNWCFGSRNCILLCQRTKRLWWLFLKPYQKYDSYRAI